MNKKLRMMLVAYTTLLAGTVGLVPSKELEDKKEEEIKNLVSQFGEEGDAVLSLFYLNAHYEKAHVVSKPDVPLGAIGTLYLGSDGSVEDYTGDKAWRGLTESRDVFVERMKECLCKITKETFEKMPPELKQIVENSQLYIASNNLPKIRNNYL